MSKTTSTIGNERYQADLRQFAGVLFGLSICATFFPLANVAGRIGPDGTTADEGIPLASLVAGLCVILIGITGMLTGYLCLVHDYSNKYLTGFLLLWVQTAFIPYITDMTDVGKTARTGKGFIPTSYNPTEGEVRFVGAMGILGIFCYGACFLGSLAFMTFALYAYQVGKPGDRASGYYRGRLGFYCILVTLAGLAQLMLGAFCISNFGNGPLEPFIGVAMFTVSFPEISVVVGLVYILNGLYGLLRSVGVIKASENDHSFQIGMAFQYICTLVLMIIVQISYLPGNTQAAAAPSRACLTLGAHVLPAFLDFKMRTTPEVLPMDFYGLDVVNDDDEGVAVEEQADDANKTNNVNKEDDPAFEA
uniref:Uncharacterized protein n=1 Tax=Cyclophora tenuis TaxID=216820 RepID=A0A7S1GQX7_CYCTE|mmetsp:Transcript_8068/g.13825  ORF Transcript_8068/g.13825 Transcript_8068/m.13825 type:complete len:363 (+) Transcript_8068:87-1175(+)